MTPNKPKWLFLVAAATFFGVSCRYWLGGFQGYLTVPIGGLDYGLAHVKGNTLWFSAGHHTRVPEYLILTVVFVAFALFVIGIWRVLRGSPERRTHAT